MTMLLILAILTILTPYAFAALAISEMKKAITHFKNVRQEGFSVVRSLKSEGTWRVFLFSLASAVFIYHGIGLYSYSFHTIMG
jgi:hypothetical protein